MARRAAHACWRIEPGVGDSTPLGFAAINNKAFFTANRSGFGRELWATDGTASGTILLKDLTTGTSSSNIQAMTAFGDQLYFIVTGTSTGKLWRTDGTAAGTTVVWSSVSTPSNAGTLAVNGNQLIFIGSDATSGNELRAVQPDGSVQLVAHIRPGSASSSPTQLTAAGNRVYFTVTTTSSGNELWTSDGTTAGTYQVIDLVAPGSSTPRILAAGDGRVFFIQTEGNSSQFVMPFYTSMGTAESTVRLPFDFSFFPSSNHAVVRNGSLYFSYGDTSTSREPWFSNGTAAGTYRLADIVPGSAGSFPSQFQKMNDRVYFKAPLDGNDVWWVTDGTVAGTQPDTNVYPPGSPTVLGGSVVFAASQLGAGLEPAVWNPIDQTTTLLADINQGSLVIDVNKFIRAGQYAYFGAHGGLWRTDGSAAGTFALPSGYYGGSAIGPDGKFYYASGASVWMTDGTTAGTQMLAEFTDQVFSLGLAGNKVVAVVGLDHRYIYAVSAIAPSTPTLLADMGNGIRSTTVTAAPGGRVIVAVKNIDNARSWTSDGTVVGTKMLENMEGESGGLLLPIGTTDTATYFISRDSIGPVGIYRTDGTEAGSYELPLSLVNSLTGATIYNNQLIVIANNHLYKSDGTVAGTVSYANLPGPMGLINLGIARAAVMDGLLYFLSADGVSPDTGLWRTDGTAAGTALVTSLPNTSTVTTVPKVIRVANHRLYIDGAGGVFVSDGAAAGTALIPGASAVDFAANSAALDDAIITVTLSGRYPLQRIATDQRGSINGTLFNDLDNDGVRDADEPSLPARSAYIDLNNNGQRDEDEPTQSTDSTGQYRFGELVTGAYRVRQVVPAGWIGSTPVADVTVTGISATAYDMGSRIPTSSSAPLVLQSRLRLDLAPITIQLRLNEAIGSIDISQMSIINLDTNAIILLGPQHVSINSDWNRVDVRINTLTLPDGNYRLQTSAGAISDVAQHTMAQAFSYEFFMFAGDANRDRVVNVLDMYILSQNWFGTGKTFAQGDFNGDSIVDAADLGILGTRWLQTLPLPQPPPPPIFPASTSTPPKSSTGLTRVAVRPVQKPVSVVDQLEIKSR